MSKLIDADTIDEYLGEWADEFYEDKENADADFMDGYCMTLNKILSSKVPEIDAVPVVYGKWFVSTDGMIHCSNCSEIPTNRIRINAGIVYDMTPIRETMHYCPNCGARMDDNG